MDKIQIYNIEQGSEAWHELRCGRFTASKFKDLMSGKSTLTYKGLLNNIVGEILSETVEETYSNDIMQRGIDLEPEASNLYSQIKDVEVNEVGFVTHEDYWPEYVGVSPDRVIEETNSILEIKCPLMKTHIGYLVDNKMPNTYKWQVQGQLLITGADYCDFMSYYPNIKPFILRVERDKEMIQELSDRMAESVEEVKKIVNQLRQ